jgi:hypothetical protein
MIDDSPALLQHEIRFVCWYAWCYQATQLALVQLAWQFSSWQALTTAALGTCTHSPMVGSVASGF